MINSSPRLQSFVNDTAALFGELRPGFATLPQSAPVLADAFAAGTRNLPGTIALDQRLLSLSQALESYGQTPAVTAGLKRLTLTAKSLRSPLAFLTPAQSTCNYVTLFLRNISSTLAEPIVTGTALRFNLVVIIRHAGERGRPVAAALHDAAGSRRAADRTDPRRSLPEHRLAGPDAGMLGRQRAVLGRLRGDRQPARERRARRPRRPRGRSR